MMVVLNLAVIAPMATGDMMVTAVNEGMSDLYLEGMCADEDCNDLSDDWKLSTEQRDFYGWSITNLEDVNVNGSEPEYETVGPVTYDVTSEREFISHDEENGEMTYREFTTYSCSADTQVPCSTEITNLNIAFNPQIIGATSTAIGAVMEITKTGFASGVMNVQMENVQASYNVSKYLDYQMYNLKPLLGYIYYNPYSAETYFLDGMFDLFDPAYGENFLEDNNLSWLDNGGVHPEWNMSNMTYAFDEAVGPAGEDLALRNGTGPLVYAAMGEPDCTQSSTTMLWNCPSDSITMQRAELWDFAHPTDLNITIARDWTMFGGMGKLVVDYGGLDDGWKDDTTGESVNASQRLLNFFDMEIDNEVAMNVLHSGNGTDDPTGILAVSESGMSFGLSYFADLDKSAAMEEYGIDSDQYETLNYWAMDWLEDKSSLPLILVGGEGYITASEFVNVSFGGEDPVNGGYLDNSLNIGGLWGLILGDTVELTAEQSGNILFGPMGLTTPNGTNLFLYSELSGKTIPVPVEDVYDGTLDLEDWTSAEAQVWNDELLAELYGIDENSAAAMRFLMKGPMFGALIPDFLIDSFNTSKYLSQSFDNWLLGWHDPVVAWLDGDGSDDMCAGWTSLETNKTYFGSSVCEDGEITNDKGTVYKICTGESTMCDKGEMIAEDGSKQLPWRDDTKYEATYGLITQEDKTGYTGGFLTGEGDLVDLSGYGLVPVNCDSEGEVKGIPVDICTANMDPLTRPIQAKLLDTDTILDATPGALPVYFGSEVTIKAEKLSGRVIAGESTSTFYLDTRSVWDQQTPPTMDNMTKVFEIKTSGELDDETAEELSSAVVTNQDFMSYWTNFDSGVDYVTAAFWVLGPLSLIAGAIMIIRKPSLTPQHDSAFSAAAMMEEEAMMSSEEPVEEEMMSSEVVIPPPPETPKEI